MAEHKTGRGRLTDEDVIQWLYGGDRDVEIKYQHIKRVRVRFKQVCCSIYHGNSVMPIPVGTEAIRETAKIDGKFCTAYTCMSCVARAMEDRPRSRGKGAGRGG